MSHTVALVCPHCCTKNVAFQLVSSVILSKNSQDNRVYYLSFFQCAYCKEGVLIRFSNVISAPPPENVTDIGRYKVERIYPEISQVKAPKYVSENIKRFFVQGVDNLKRSNYDAAGMMFRKVLDVSLKEQSEDGSGTLYQRIKRLADGNKLTPSMAEWAHQIRIDGNEAAHDEAPLSREVAESLRDFTELMLMYLYTLPGMLEERRAAHGVAIVSS
ncbi:DUF4145 domain-containing protein [Solidesulfovibrio magneticus]|uniref:DUF4145 domain-containing protein n=1 Tax=Solidesulfovibrio magneticus TaxID=184917 RepID=UPI0009D6687B|nr:DUF4145 domain-containing protein [Solidesulfovibrio magneticus]